MAEIEILEKEPSMLNRVERMVIGLRHPPVHKIRDRIGEIIDTAFYLQDAGRLKLLRFKADQFGTGTTGLRLTSVDDDSDEALLVDTKNILTYFRVDPPRDSLDPGKAEALASDTIEIAQFVYNHLGINELDRIGIVFEWSHETDAGQPGQSWVNERFLRYQPSVGSEIDSASMSIGYTSKVEADDRHGGERRTTLNLNKPYQSDPDNVVKMSCDFQRFFEGRYKIKSKESFSIILSEIAHAIRQLEVEAAKIFEVAETS